MRPRWHKPFRPNETRGIRVLVSVLVCSATHLAVTAPPASGAMIVVETPPGAVVGGQPVSASATFTTSADQVEVLLESLYADPKSVGQNLSGLRFTLDTVPTGVSLITSSGTERTVARNGTFTLGGSVPTGWSVLSSGADVTLNVLGTP